MKKLTPLALLQRVIDFAGETPVAVSVNPLMPRFEIDKWKRWVKITEMELEEYDQGTSLCFHFADNSYIQIKF